MSTAPVTWAERVANFDRRWLFLIMGLAIVIPLLKPCGIPLVPTEPVRATYSQIEALKENDVVFVSIDLDPSATPELEPFFRAVMLHLKRKNVKVVIATTWYAAPPLIEAWIRWGLEQQIIADGDTTYKGAKDRVYKKNVDYVYLGFREGKTATISNMGADLRKTFDGRANDGTLLDGIAMMNGIKALKDFKLSILISAGSPGAKEYVQYVQGRYNLKMVTASTSVLMTDLAPYYQSGQLLGVVGGLVKVAEYESMVGIQGDALKASEVINWGNMVVVLAIVLGNIIYFVGRRARRAAAPPTGKSSSEVA